MVDHRPWQKRDWKLWKRLASCGRYGKVECLLRCITIMLASSCSSSISPFDLYSVYRINHQLWYTWCRNIMCDIQYSSKCSLFTRSGSINAINDLTSIRVRHPTYFLRPWRVINSATYFKRRSQVNQWRPPTPATARPEKLADAAALASISSQAVSTRGPMSPKRSASVIWLSRQV